MACVMFLSRLAYPDWAVKECLMEDKNCIMNKAAWELYQPVIEFAAILMLHLLVYIEHHWQLAWHHLRKPRRPQMYARNTKIA